ncbi:MAG TPA: MBL fold metallo-hydrolase [Candidatus Paceibacterota bacterium]
MKVYHAEKTQRQFLRVASHAAIFAAVVSLVLSAFFFVSAGPNAEVEMHFLDVGQGDGFLLKTAGGASLLIDAGPPAGTFKESLSESLNIFDKSIDVIVATHPDADHIGGMKWLIDRFNYGIYLDSFVTGTSKLFEEVEKMVGEDSAHRSEGGPNGNIEAADVGARPKTNRLHAYEGMKMRISDRDKNGKQTGTPVEVQVLAPSFKYVAEKIQKCKSKVDAKISRKNEKTKTGKSKSASRAEPDYRSCFPKDLMETNEMSVVMRVTHGENSVMMTGDAPVEMERYIIEQSKSDASGGLGLKSKTLKAGHHGSKTSTASDFVQAVSPDFAIISSGTSNKYGHPNQSVMETFQKFGVKILRTDELGTVTFYSDGNQMNSQ